MIVIVTGLPRSGTTMMMRMLEIGGVLPYYDADGPGEKSLNDVLRETHKHKILPDKSEWFKDLDGMAVKIFMPYKRRPPEGYIYRWIWMDRDRKQQVRSFRKFVKMVTDKETINTKRTYTKSFNEDIGKGFEAMRSYPGSKILRVRFESVLTDPLAASKKVAEFLEMDMDVEAMSRTVMKRTKRCLPYFLEERLVYA